MLKISLGEEELIKLLNGEIIQYKDCEIVFKDIGMQRIVEITLIAFAMYVAKIEDEDLRALALIKLDKALNNLVEK